MTIHEGDKVFTGLVPTVSIHSDPGDPTYRTLEVEWTEQGVEQRLYLYFAADDTDWWVSEIRTRDGYPDADWIAYHGPFFRTPRGETFEGDVHLIGGVGRAPGQLDIVDLRLAAFAPDTGPAALTGCHPDEGAGGPLGAGELVVFVETDQVMTVRDQPPQGWGCEGN